MSQITTRGRAFCWRCSCAGSGTPAWRVICRKVRRKDSRPREDAGENRRDGRFGKVSAMASMARSASTISSVLIIWKSVVCSSSVAELVIDMSISIDSDSSCSGSGPRAEPNASSTRRDVGSSSSSASVSLVSEGSNRSRIFSIRRGLRQKI